MRLSVLLLLAIRLLGPMVFCSGADALTVSWADLANTVAKRPVVVEIDRQQILRGELLSQDANGILVAVHSSKPGGLYAKYANVPVDRNSITRFRVVKDPQRVSGRWAGTIAGFFIGPYLGIAAGGREQDPRILLGMIGGMVAGYHVGKSMDKSLIDILILDQKAPAEPDSTTPTSASATCLPDYLLPGPLGDETAGQDAQAIGKRITTGPARWEPGFAVAR